MLKLGQKHIMLSYQWDSQPTVIRINESLKRRGYITWFDLEVADAEDVAVREDANRLDG